MIHFQMSRFGLSDSKVHFENTNQILEQKKLFNEVRILSFNDVENIRYNYFLLLNKWISMFLNANY